MGDPLSKHNYQEFVASVGEQRKSSRAPWWLAVVIAVVVATGGLAWYAVDLYNTIQTHDERVDADWQHVLTQYQRRADLAPNLIAVVKSYATHESRLFNDVTAARAKAAARSSVQESGRDPAAMESFQESQRQLSRSLAQLLVVAENYPDLKADSLYRDLMVQLEGTENRIAYSRHRHIEAVVAYNLGIKRFPGNLVAERYGFAARPKLSVEDDSAITVVPKFDGK